MDWRTWGFQKLSNSIDVTNIIPAASMFGSGSVTERQVKPFMVLNFGQELPNVGNSTITDLLVWVYDDPGDYDQINTALKLVRTTLVGPVSDPTGMACTWQGDSADLSDDSYSAITKYASFQLVGRDN